jgi:hypothetical protein
MITHTTYIVGWQGSLLGTNKFGHSHQEDEMMCNYAHDPSMFNHFNPPTTILQKVKPLAHIKHTSQSHAHNRRCLLQVHIISWFKFMDLKLITTFI